LAGPNQKRVDRCPLKPWRRWAAPKPGINFLSDVLFGIPSLGKITGLPRPLQGLAMTNGASLRAERSNPETPYLKAD